LNEAPSWSPDGKAIVFDTLTFSSNTLVIYVMSVDTRDPPHAVRQMTRAHSPNQQRLNGQQQLNSPQWPRGRMHDLASSMPLAMAHAIQNNAAWPRWSPELH
jgi:Tol biopolymer transport system component